MNHHGIGAPSAGSPGEGREEALRGWVFNIQPYSLHDGAGIRTVVFLKGCPLRCTWCSNPESQRRFPELAVAGGKCLGSARCGLCLERCPAAAIRFTEERGIQVDRQRCERCLECVPRCPTKALHAFGQALTAGEILAAVAEDNIFYTRSQGGLTLSGGEPLMQWRFAQKLLGEARRQRLNTALETCGYGSWRALANLARYCDAILFDIKSLDDAAHRRATGRSNRRIRENLLLLRRHFPRLPVHVRTPLIPGFNDSRAAIADIVDFILAIPLVSYEILPYHRLGRDKYQLLGREYAPGEAQLDPDCARQLIAFARDKCGTRYGLAD
ncbi:TPA: glycyl-radical enzyme activating protein [Raoultella planticola]